MNIELYVAPWGNDAHPGTKESPLKTVAGAQLKLRIDTQTAGYNGEATVYLSKGEYLLTDTLGFTREDSYPVCYRALNNEPVVITSAKPLTMTESITKGRRQWTVFLPEVLQGKRYRSLLMNGVNADRPRLPKEGFYEIKNVPNIDFDKADTDPAFANELFKGTDRFFVNEGEMDDWCNLGDVELVMPHYWVDERLEVESFDKQTGLVVTKLCSIFSLADDFVRRYSRYAIENVYEALSEGQWYLDRSTGILTYLPTPEQTLENTALSLPTLINGITFDGAAFIRFEGITLRGFDWQLRVNDYPGYLAQTGKYCGTFGQSVYGISGAVTFQNSRCCGFSRCRFEAGGEYAVDIGYGCSNIVIEDCEITAMGGGGVKINGAAAEEPAEGLTTHNIVRNNHIHDCGKIFNAACGILSRHSAYNQFYGNHIHHLFYTAVSVGWVWGHGPSTTHHNRIENNHLHDIGQGLLSDMGGIYTLGEQPGTVIRGNIVHDIYKRNYGGWGIYPDEGSSHLVIENNLCYKMSSQGFHQHYGRENIVRNNIFAFCGAGTAAVSRVTETHNGINFYHNVFLSDNGPFYINRRNETYRKGIISDCNLFYDYSGRGFVSGDGDNDGELTMKMVRGYDFAQWQALGHDKHSVFGDPCFADPQNGDFTVTDSTLLEQIGFVLFIGKIGDKI